MRDFARRMEYVKLAERILQKQYVPGSSAGVYSAGGMGRPGEYITVRSADEVLAAAEKVREWCERSTVVSVRHRAQRASTRTK